jgi:hypothetical protein
VVLGERDQNIRAFPPERTQEPLTKGIGLGIPHRRVQYPEAQVVYALIELLRVNAIPAIDMEHRQVGLMQNFSFVISLLNKTIAA